MIASIMMLWHEGDPLASEWEKTAVREDDGAVFRREARSRFDPVTDLEHMEDLYQKIVEGAVVKEELHRRSPATRSYTQPQARVLLQRAGFHNVQLFSEFTFDPAKREDTLCVIIGQRPDSR